MARVFISHASQDKDLAGGLHRWLVREGHDVFIDNDLHGGLVVGDEWQQRLHERLRWADAVVCLVSPAFLTSVWCSAEVGIAQAQGSRVLPLSVEPGTRHPLLDTSLSADYAADPEAARSSLREALRRIDAVGGWGWPDGRSPFPGLQPFDTDMHRAFFGRAEEVAALAGLLRSPVEQARHALVLVVGPSGCGKSSLVRAGVVPALAAESGWLTLSPFFPGRDPVTAFAGELAASGRRQGLPWTLADVRRRIEERDGLLELADELLVIGSGRERQHRVLVVVDQFEEVLTQTTPAGRTAFADLLRTASTGRIRVVGTMRPEALEALLSSQDLAGLSIHTFTLRSLRHDVLPTVIERPAQLAGIEVDASLVNRLVSDTGGGEALPLLAYTLAELARGIGRGGRLSMTRYEELGGVPGALQRQADAALVAACETTGRSREEVVAGLLRLVTVDERGNPVRWRAQVDDLPDLVRTELEAFISRRLLSTDADQGGDALLGVAHEALLSAWRPLADAVDATAVGLRSRREVEQAADQWAQAGRPLRRLWEGNQLASAVEATGARLRRTGPGWLPASDREIVTDHVELSARGRDFLYRSVRSDRRRRRRGMVVLSALLAVTVAAAGIALAQRQDAVRQQQGALQAQRLATARELAAEAETLRDTRPQASLMLSAEAVRLGSAEARAGLVTTLVQSHYAGTLTGQNGAITSMAFSPDGKFAATGNADGTVVLWTLGGRPPWKGEVLPIGPLGIVSTLAFSPDSGALAAGSASAASSFKVQLWDIAHRTATSLSGSVGAVAFSADDRLLAVGGESGTIALWDVADRAHPAELVTMHGDIGSLGAMAFSPDLRTMATAVVGFMGFRICELWDISSRSTPVRLARLSGHSGPIDAVAYSPDGRMLATGSEDRTVILWDVGDPAHPAQRSTLIGHSAGVRAVAYSKDGRSLATGGIDGTAIIWYVEDPSRPARIRTLNGYSGTVRAVAFSPDGRTLATGTDDSSATLWDAGDGMGPTRLATVGFEDTPVMTDIVQHVRAVAFDRAGRTLVTANSHTIALWDAANLKQPARLATFNEEDTIQPGVTRFSPILTATFSPNGRTLVVGTANGLTMLWDVSDRARPMRVAVLDAQAPTPVVAAVFSPDSRTLATSVGQVVFLWDLGDLAHPTRAGIVVTPAGVVDSLAYSPDGRTLATGSLNGKAMLWAVGNRSQASRLAVLEGHTQGDDAVEFSADGRMLAIGGRDGNVILWDVSRPSRPTRLATLGGYPGAVHSVAFGRDGRTLVTGSGDDVPILWDLGDPSRPVRLNAPGAHTDFVDALAFSPDGRTVVTDGGGDNSVAVWDVGSTLALERDAVARACAVAGPGLSQADWARYVPDLPYERVCL